MSKPHKPLEYISEKSLKHNRGRYASRPRATRPKGKLGPPSTWLSPTAKNNWARLVRHSPAILGENDRPMLEIASVLQTKLAAGRIRNAEMATLITVLAKLGQIPTDRRPPEKKRAVADPYDEFAVS